MKHVIDFFGPFRVKYLSYDLEKSINREQFFWRVLGILIMSYLVWGYITYNLPAMPLTDIEKFEKGEPLDFPGYSALFNILWLLVYGIFYWIFMNLCIKRYADFGESSKTPKVLILVFYALNAYAFLLGIYAGYFGNPVMKLVEEESLLVTIITSGIEGLMMGSMICIGIMILFLIFRPGLKRENASLVD